MGLALALWGVMWCLGMLPGQVGQASFEAQLARIAAQRHEQAAAAAAAGAAAGGGDALLGGAAGEQAAVPLHADGEL
jgi:hypothetical protein